MPAEAAIPHTFAEHFADGRAPAMRERLLAIEAPVAIEINGLGYAVMMATPADLPDYALGFSLSEQLIASPPQLLSAEASEVPAGGWMLRIQLAADDAAPLMERARLRLAEGSCGLCGIESLEQVLRPLSPVAARLDVDDAAIFRAVAALPDLQPLGRATRAVHAAAFCAPSGEVLLVREDVGRHNALDKLLGAMGHAGLGAGEGFIVLTARCSFELVQKAVIAGCPLLVTISAASTLAAQQAAAHGLRLVSLARDDSFLAG
ncbi:formate dehydrogenase family accessory protein FdhD [Novosphingobium fuchskuhlense]|uniref:Sulfur carrier protein FdhD n=1 Tax=Novosphingobium fuchskuhlense TaxID=1117702 RepID=A0A117UZ70_9SPHN|nr:formate dehydrogenase accessory sulfurtransferase FdhD [Novosphingobium fuchskuhlense]KUR73569.1 formate dehydrogenase family accessory protein FdhD [Novosphingobium fuchskuhlense]